MANVSNYMEQGGAVWSIEGTLDIESGGNVNVKSGGKVTLPVTTASTGENVSNSGLTVLSSAGTKTYTLDAPEAGVVKSLFAVEATTNVLTVNSGSTDITFDGTNQNLTFDANNEAVHLIGQSATRWLVLSNQGSVGLS
jgi:hypothetical protein